MAFPRKVIVRAWLRQARKCAYCGKRLTPSNKDKGGVGAWHPHHRKPERLRGSNTLHNCVIFCINEPENCHLNIGHEGAWGNYVPLNDHDLPYLYAGRRR